MSLIHQCVRSVSSVVQRNPALARTLLNCIPDWHMHVTIPEIGKLRVRMRRNRSMWLRPPLTHEWYPLAALKAVVKPGDVVWDVGANLGLYARWLVTHLKAGRVCSFEPMSENISELKHNLELGAVTDKVQVVPWALSDVDGEVEFQVDDMQSASGAVSSVCDGKASKARAALGLPPKTEKVTSRTIDSILDKGELPAPDVLKIDIEGAERMLLDGGTRFFSNSPACLVLETHGLEVSKSCLEFLFDHGFQVAACVRSERNPKRHMILERSFIDLMDDQYDAHFIIATKSGRTIPAELDYVNL
ncbi:MAG: FkbM family methyltransferase [Verrucomicrobiota bacterium]